MKSQDRYHHFRVDWPGESSSESVTLCGIKGEDVGTGQIPCPNCAQVGTTLNSCGLGPESLRELFDTLRVIGPSEVKAKMEALRDLGVQMDMQGRVATQLKERCCMDRGGNGTGHQMASQ